MPQPVWIQESHSTFHSIIYLSHQRSCLTTFPNTEKKVENIIRSRVFLMNLELFENVVEHCLEHWIYLLNFCPKWGLSCLLSFKYFSQRAVIFSDIPQFELGNILSSDLLRPYHFYWYYPKSTKESWSLGIRWPQSPASSKHNNNLSFN